MRATIGRRLLLTACSLLALVTVVSVAWLGSLGGLKDDLDTATGPTARRLILADSLLASGARMQSAQRGLILTAYAKSPGGGETVRQRAAEIRKALDEITPLLEDDEGRRLAAGIAGAVNNLVTAFNDVERLAAAGDADGASRLSLERSQPLYESIGQAAGRLAEAQRRHFEQARDEAAGTSARAWWLACMLLALAMGMGAVSLWVVRGITAGLDALVSELAQGADQVAGASGQVSSSSQALAQGASQQAATLEETSSSTEEIHSMTRKNAEDSQTAAQLMQESANLVGDANRRLEQMVGSMKEITTSSDKISKIIKVIDEIAFQTNILALNAAVEAARAGEAGMGFAVVADEVRNLAQRCAQAAKDTASLIEESIARSGEGSSRLNEVAESIRSITDNSGRVKTLVEEINLGSQEQARGIEQVARAVSQMEQVTQKTAACAEQGASAGEELSAQSQSLRQAVDKLAEMVGGARRPAPAPRTLLAAPVAVRKSPPKEPARVEFPLDAEDFREF